MRQSPHSLFLAAAGALALLCAGEAGAQTATPAARPAAQPDVAADPPDPDAPETPPPAPPVALLPPLTPASGRVLPVRPAGQRLLADDPLAETEDPFGFPGYRMGAFIVVPTLDFGIGASTNAAGKAGGSAAGFVKATPDLAVKSDWDRHSFDMALRGTYSGYPSDTGLNTFPWSASANARFDLADFWTGSAALRYGQSRGKASDPSNPSGTAVPSTATGRGVSLGLTHEIGRVGLTLRGDVDRTTYSGGKLGDGSPITSDALRDNVRTVFALRTTYDGTASLKPYAELQLLNRSFDAAARAGRETSGAAFIIGTAIDTGAFIKGTASIGYSREELRDDSLGALQGVVVNAGIAYMPTRLTKITLDLRSALEPTTLSGSPGTHAHELAFAIEQSFRRDLTATLGASLGWTDYLGLARRDRSYGLSGELAWRVDRHWQAYARADWGASTTTAPDEDYQALTVMAGIRLR